MKRQYRLEVKVKNDGLARSLDERTRIILFRAVRELLVNVAKHAGVRRARVSICRKGNRIIVKVEDHGVGFDPKVVHDPKETRGVGLFSIRERLEYLGGSMDIRSLIGKKTEITLFLPVAVDPQSEGKTRS
jgi:two-component system, chemotaxis family, CheB/CheR fusion protein